MSADQRDRLALAVERLGMIVGAMYLNQPSELEPGAKVELLRDFLKSRLAAEAVS